MLLEEYTIANIITPLAESGVGIIRLSGRDSFRIIDQLFSPYQKDTWHRKESHKAYLGILHTADGAKLDEALILLMKGPHSFTGEDTVEIHCHGNPFILKETLKELFAHGARKSTAGEFTRRAFLNGKLDLTQSEAILDTIRANNRKALNNSLNQLDGRLKERISALKEEVIRMTAYLEASIDFPDDEIEESYTRENLLKESKGVNKEIDTLLSSYNQGRIIKDGVLTVLIGRPNAGKSSLLNSLLQEDRAIITDLPGTTRDAIEEQVNIGDFVLKLVDTAGFRETQDLVETKGIEKTYAYIRQAQLVIFLADATEGLTAEDREMISHLQDLDKKYLVVYNKMDLLAAPPTHGGLDSLFISAKEGLGLDELKTTIKSMFLTDDLEDTCISNLRYVECLSKSRNAIAAFIANLSQGSLPYDLLSIDLKEAYQALASITGDDYSTDLIDKIFSQFCIGK